MSASPWRQILISDRGGKKSVEVVCYFDFFLRYNFDLIFMQYIFILDYRLYFCEFIFKYSLTIKILL